MDDFLEFDNEKKSVKSINLDDFSIEDLRKYIKELDEEKKRTDRGRFYTEEYTHNFVGMMFAKLKEHKGWKL